MNFHPNKMFLLIFSFSAMVLSDDRKRMYCCTNENRNNVTVYQASDDSLCWEEIRTLPSARKFKMIVSLRR